MVRQHYTLARPFPTLNKRLNQRCGTLVLSAHRKQGFETLFKTIKGELRPKFPEGRLISYGSYPAGVALAESDLDLTFLFDTKNEQLDELETCHEIKRILKNCDIKNPRVAKLQEKYSAMGTFRRYNIKFSLSLNNYNGPLVSSIFSAAAKDKLARHLILLVKEFAQVQQLNSVQIGFPSSTAYCYLTVVVLQRMSILKRFRKSDLAPLRDLLHDMSADCLKIKMEVSEPPPSPPPILADLLYRVFRFFTCEVNLDIYALSVTRSCFMRKADLGWPHIDVVSGKVIQRNLVCIENPFAQENLCRNMNSSGLEQTRKAFTRACEILRRGESPDLLFQSLSA